MAEDKSEEDESEEDENEEDESEEDEMEEDELAQTTAHEEDGSESAAEFEKEESSEDEADVILPNQEEDTFNLRIPNWFAPKSFLVFKNTQGRVFELGNKLQASRFTIKGDKLYTANTIFNFSFTEDDNKIKIFHSDQYICFKDFKARVCDSKSIGGVGLFEKYTLR